MEGDLAKLVSDLTREGTVTPQRAAQELLATRDRLKARAEAEAPRGETGDLAAGFEPEQSGPFEVAVVNRTRQAFFQEFGTVHHGPQASLFVFRDEAEADLVRRLNVIAGRELL